MRHINKTALVCILTLCLTKGYTASNSEPDYLELADKALYLEYAEVKMEVYKKGKLQKYYKLEFYRKEMKMRMEFLEPAVEKGRRMLNDDSNMWMYLPRTSKVMKLPLKQAFMGSDASNRDLMRMAFKKDYELTGKTKISDKLLALELKAKDLSVSYNKVILHFDTQFNRLVKQEMYSLSGKLIKTIDYLYSQDKEGNSPPGEMIIKDELLKDSLTKMYYDKVRKSNDKPSVFFTLGSIKQ